jgi:hypothetical protein
VVRHRLPAVLLLALGFGCLGDRPPPPTLPSPAPTVSIAAPGPVPGAHDGPTHISFLVAEPPPGSTLAACGTDASGCDGSIRMRFRLSNPTGGPALYAVGFLHGTNRLACWRGRTAPLRLEAAVPQEILVVFDTRDPQACPVPFEIGTMKVVVEGPVEVASVQEWAVRYQIRP